MTLEKLVVIIQAETAALEKSLDRVKSQLNVLDKASTRTGDRISSAFTGAASSINRAFKAIKIGALIAALSSFGRTALSSASDLQEWQNVVDVAFGDAVGQANLFAKIAIKQFGLSEIAAKKLTGTFMAMADGIGLSNAAGAKMAIQLSGLAADMASFFNSDYETTANALEAIFTGQSRALRQFGVVLSDANLEAFRLERGIETAYSQMNQAQKVALRYNYVLAMTANAQNDYARTAMSWANQMRLLANNWQQLASTVGSNLVKILAPAVAILNKILTMAIAVVNAIAKVFGGQGISGLATDAGGAVDGVAGGVEDIEDNFGGATKAAKKFKATIAGFDELEILKGPTDSGGSGAGGLGGGGIGVDDLDSYFEMYDEDGMLNQFEAFMEKIKGMMDADNWEGVGGEFAKGLNTIISAVDSFITDKLEPAGVKWAERIARVLNGLVSGFDWSGLGKTLGDGLNALIHIANTWYENFNSLNLGIGIGTSIMSWFTTVDWEGIGKYISNKLNFLGDILKGLAQTINFQQIKENLQTALANVFANLDVEGIKSAITTLVNGLVEVIKGLDWYQIGYTVGEMLSGVDWLGVFKTVKDAMWEAIKGAWNGLMSDGKNFLLGTIGKIASWFKESFWGPLVGAIIKVLSINALLGAFRGFFMDGRDNFLKELIKSGGWILTNLGGLTPGFWKKFSDKLMNEHEMAFFSDVIKNGPKQAIKDFFSASLDDAKWWGSNFVGIFEAAQVDGAGKLKAFMTAIQGMTGISTAGFGAIAVAIASLTSSYGGLGGAIKRIGKVFSDAWTHVKNFANSIGFSDKIEQLKTAFQNILEPLKKLYEFLGLLKPLWEIVFTAITGVITTAANVIVGAITVVIDIISGVMNIIAGAAEFIVGVVTLNCDLCEKAIDDVWTGIKQIFQGAIDFIVNIVSGFVQGIIDFFADLKYNLIGDPIVIDMWEGIKQVFSDAIEAVKNFVQGMVDKLIELWTNLKNKAIEIYTAIKDFLSQTWDNIKTKTSETWTAIKEYISTLWTNIKTVFTNALNAIKTKISDIWNNIKTTTTNVWNGLKSTLSSVWDNLKTKASNISTSIKDAFVNAYKGITDKWNGFKDFFKGVWSGIADMCKSAMNNMISKLNQFHVSIPDWVPFIGGNSFGLSIPYLAKGGVIDSPTLAMLGEYSGARSNPEIAAPQSLLKETIDASNGEMVSALYQIATQIISAIDNVDFSVSIGDEEIGSAADRANKAYKKRTGKPLFSM